MSHTAREAEDVDKLSSGYSGQILLLVGLCSLTSHLGWLVLPPLLPEIIDDLEITAARAGFALTVLTVLSAAGRYPGGRLADQLSRKTVLAFCLLAWTVGFLVLSVATNYPLFLLGVALVGIGLGAYVPAAFALLSDLFDRKQGRAFGINNAAFNLGGILASGLAIAVLAFGSWRFAFLPVVGILLGLFALLHLWSEEPYTLHRVDFEFSATAGRILFEPQIRLILLVAALFAFVWNGSISFLPTFLEVERGFSPRIANAAFASVFLTGVVATPLSGAVGDRFGPIRTILVMVCFAIVGLGAVVTAPSVIGVFVGVVTFAVGLTGFWPVMTSYVMGQFPDGSKAGDYGVVGTVYLGVGSVGPTYVGTVSEVLHFTGAYVTLVVVLGFSLLVVSWIYVH